MGGRLLRHAEKWECLNPDIWVLRTVTEGYRLEFTAPPPQTGLLKSTPIPQIEAQRVALEKEISDLLSKKAIRRASPLESPQLFRSSFFLTPKKPDTWRPILNLKPLNKQYIRPRRFRMETLASIIPLLLPNSWATTLDLKDAYLHVPIHPDHQRFLAFTYDNEDFVFQAMPFGLSTAPLVFTRITRAVTSFLRRRGITVYAYLDDWLIVSSSREDAVRDTRFTITLLQLLGWVINEEKSSLVPSQSVTYLGARLDLRSGMAFPSLERLKAIQEVATQILQKPRVQVRLWLRLLGLQASLVDVVPYCRLRMRLLQLHVLRKFLPARDPLSTQIELTSDVKPSILWWMSNQNVLTGRPFNDHRPQVTVTTDASLSGWGATLGTSTVSGSWEDQQRSYHINVLELEAVANALRHWRHQLKDKSVTVLSDNSTVVAYLNKQGGTRSETLCRRTVQLLQEAQADNILIRASHLAGKDNVVADALSRGWLLDQKEWSLAQVWADHVFHLYDRPHVDLFATAANAKLPLFVSRRFHPRAWAVDALSLDWSGLTAYAFPPWNLIHKVLSKLANSHTSLILVAPCWPKQPWFPLLLRLLVDFPFKFPPKTNLLSQLQGRVFYRDIKTLQLAAWPLSGISSDRKAFQRKLWVSQLPPGDPPLFTFMTPECTDSRVGQGRLVSIPWKPQ